MPPLHKFQRRLPLGQCLETLDNIPGTYTHLQQRNIRDWKRLYRCELRNPQLSNQFAVVDASRTPSQRTTWGRPIKNPDTCQCLTASGPSLHVFALGRNLGKEPLPLDRPIRNGERARIQGFSGDIVEAASHMSIVDANRIFGNAMSVPVVGSFIGRELHGAIRALGIENLAAQFSSERASARRYPHGCSHLTDIVALTRNPSVAVPPSLSSPPSPKDNCAADDKVDGVDSSEAKRRCL